MSKLYRGVRLQRLREQRGMSQVALAKALGISPSYLNQIEHNQRPLTAPILLRINQEFGVDVQMFSEEDESQLVSEVREVLAETGGESISLAELRSLVDNAPAVARSILELHRRARAASEKADGLAGPLGDQQRLPPFSVHGPYEEVRDYLNNRRDHIEEIDDRAEEIFREAGLVIGDAAPRLEARLLDRHEVRVAVTPSSDMGAERRRFDASTRTLRLADYLRPGQQAFQMAYQLAPLEIGPVIDGLVQEGKFSSDASKQLARVAFSNYFAGALTMPYMAFLESAESLGYDVQQLANRFAVGFEAICHRLSTLQRPRAEGLPFFMVRVDRAGNVSKRHSAADFHFSRVGGTCPLWIVYEAFNQPERILTQVATMPDERSYFWIAKQVTSGPVGYGRPQRTFAVSLGCDLRHAHRIVYSRGVDLTDSKIGTKIGPGCKVCERRECPQRAFPSLLNFAESGQS